MLDGADAVPGLRDAVNLPVAVSHPPRNPKISWGDFLRALLRTLDQKLIYRIIKIPEGNSILLTTSFLLMVSFLDKHTWYQ